MKCRQNEVPWKPVLTIVYNYFIPSLIVNCINTKLQPNAIQDHLQTEEKREGVHSYWTQLVHLVETKLLLENAHDKPTIGTRKPDIHHVFNFFFFFVFSVMLVFTFLRSSCTSKRQTSVSALHPWLG